MVKYATLWYILKKEKNMLIFKTKVFTRWATELGVTDENLVNTIDEIQRGLFDVNLGGHVYKKRVPIGNRGKRGGTRTILAYKAQDKAIFMLGYAKNKRENITKKEEEVLIDLAKYYFNFNE